MIRILLVVAFAIMSSQSQACDDQMEQQTQIMQQQLFSQNVRNRNKDKQTTGLILMLKNKYDKNVITLAGLMRYY